MEDNFINNIRKENCIIVCKSTNTDTKQGHVLGLNRKPIISLNDVNVHNTGRFMPPFYYTWRWRVTLFKVRHATEAGLALKSNKHIMYFLIDSTLDDPHESITKECYRDVRDWYILQGDNYSIGNMWSGSAYMLAYTRPVCVYIQTRITQTTTGAGYESLQNERIKSFSVHLLS